MTVKFSAGNNPGKNSGNNYYAEYDYKVMGHTEFDSHVSVCYGEEIFLLTE
jgi:hypothetical protein